jgi:hypothetical protein
MLSCLEEETLMPVSTLIALAAVIATFAIFACALAWAQLQTRHLAGITASASVAVRPRRRAF